MVSENPIATGYTTKGCTNPETQAAADRLLNGRCSCRFFKRASDVVFSLCLLVLLSWLFLLAAVAIKLGGPDSTAILRQTRVGKDGRGFQMYIFRSMMVDAELRLVELGPANEKTDPVFKLRDDLSVTRACRVIRKFSIDELLQFANVLKSDLSVVGPRPAFPRETTECTNRHRQRLFVKQGLTCFWQVQLHRDDVDFEDYVELDLRYIRECLACTDVKLIAKTVTCALSAQGS